MHIFKVYKNTLAGFTPKIHRIFLCITSKITKVGHHKKIKCFCLCEIRFFTTGTFEQTSVFKKNTVNFLNGHFIIRYD